MVDALLIQPPIRDFYLTFKRTVPYGLALIAASLRRHGFKTIILDALAASKSRTLELPAEMEYIRKFYRRPDQSPMALFYDYRHFGRGFESVGKIAGESGASLVGISSLFTPYFEQALSVARIVKKNLPSCRITLGGHHPSNFPREVMQHKEIDFIIRGEGEEAMPMLAEALKRGSSLEEIPGIVFRGERGGLHISPPAVVKNLDDLPLPAIDLINLKFYQRDGKKSLVVTAGRGCPLKCAYCSVGASSFIKSRQRETGRVLKEIEAAVKNYGAGFIDFEDENLSLNREWFMSLMKGVVQKFGGAQVELRAMNGLLPSSLDEEMIALMKEAGFKTLNLSLCSRSPEQLKRFKRPDVSSAFDRALVWAEKHGLKAAGYILVGAPYQNPEDSLKDLLSMADKKVLAAFSVFYPAPGSSYYEVCRELGVLPDGFSLMRSSLLPVSHSTSRLESLTLLRLARVLNFIKRLLDKKMLGPDFLNKGDFAFNEQSPAKTSQNLKNRRAEQRLRWGVELLKSFFEDGKLRGVDRRGEIFEHPASGALTAKFIQGLKKLRLRGT